MAPLEAIKQQTALRATALKDLTTDGDSVEREKEQKRAEQVTKRGALSLILT